MATGGGSPDERACRSLSPDRPALAEHVLPIDMRKPVSAVRQCSQIAEVCLLQAVQNNWPRLSAPHECLHSADRRSHPASETASDTGDDPAPWRIAV